MLFLSGLLLLPIFSGLFVFYVVLGVVDSPKWFFASVFQFIPVLVIYMAYKSVYEKNLGVRLWVEDKLFNFLAWILRRM